MAKYQPKKTAILTKEYLTEQYLVKKLTILQIAQESNTSKNTVSKYLKQLGLHTRDKLIRPFHKKGISHPKYDHIFTLEYLQKQYVENKLSSVQLGRLHNVSTGTIFHYLKLYGIPVRKYLPNEDISGLHYGKFTILGLANKSLDRKNPKYKCLCECGNIVVKRFNDIKRYTEYSNCGECYHYKTIMPHIWNNFVRGAKNRNIPFNITKEYVWEIYEKQNRKCAYTGLDLEFSNTCIKTTASLDRIDSDIGYEVGNIQILHKALNLLKGSVNNEVFIHICKLVAEYNKEYDTSSVINKEHIVQKIKIFLPK